MTITFCYWMYAYNMIIRLDIICRSQEADRIKNHNWKHIQNISGKTFLNQLLNLVFTCISDFYDNFLILEDNKYFYTYKTSPTWFLLITLSWNIYHSSSGWTLASYLINTNLKLLDFPLQRRHKPTLVFETGIHISNLSIFPDVKIDKFRV